MRAIVNETCAGCTEAIKVETDETAIVTHDESDPDLAPSLVRVTVDWSCPNCSNDRTETLYATARELVHGSWVGDTESGATSIDVDYQPSNVEAGQVRTQTRG